MDFSVIDPSCAIRVDGRTLCWDAAVLPNDPPLFAPAPFQTATISFADAWSNSCRVHDDGSLWCWGTNQFGAVGNGSQQPQAAPLRIGGTMRWKAITAGGKHFCALDDKGATWCWGDNSVGQLALPSGGFSNVPVKLSF